MKLRFKRTSDFKTDFCVLSCRMWLAYFRLEKFLTKHLNTQILCFDWRSKSRNTSIKIALFHFWWPSWGAIYVNFWFMDRLFMNLIDFFYLACRNLWSRLFCFVNTDNLKKFLMWIVVSPVREMFFWLLERQLSQDILILIIW
jgi:hypothetical protein